MDKLTLLDTLKSKSMTLSLEEIQEIMDEELNKDAEEMDIELIDLCADVLDKAYFGTENTALQEEIHNNEKTPARTKRIKFSKVLLIAAVFIILFSIALPVSARYLHNEASDKVAQFFIDHFKIDLRSGNTNAINHSDENIDIIKNLKDAGFDDIILPSVLLGDDYSKENINISEDENLLSAEIDFKSKTNKVHGYIGITRYETDINEFISGTGDMADEFDSVKQLQINGIDILIFSNGEKSYIVYVDKNIEYDIHIYDCDLDFGVEIAKTLE